MDVPQLNSPAETYCQHSVVKKGCSIYNERPKVCRDFGCLWWHQIQIPERLRPDRLSVMFEIPPFCKVIVGYAVGHINPYRSRDVHIMIGKILKSGHPVVMKTGKQTRTFVADGWTIKQVRNELREAYKKNQEAWQLQVTQLI